MTATEPHWNEEVDAKADILFASLSLAKLRKRQGLCEQMIAQAYRQGKEDALTNLQRMQAALTRAVLSRC